MKRLPFLLGLLFVFVVSVLFAAEQSTLAEVAKKEKERRAKLKATKTITNKDVEEWKAKQKSSGALIEGSETAEGQEPSAETQTGDASKEQDVSNNEEYWRDKAEQANERLKKAQEKVDGTQSDINALNRAWYSGDMDDQRRQVEYERGKRLEEIETAKKELEEAKQAQENLEDEARQAGAPPGWVRTEEEPEAENNPDQQQQ